MKRIDCRKNIFPEIENGSACQTLDLVRAAIFAQKGKALVLKTGNALQRRGLVRKVKNTSRPIKWNLTKSGRIITNSIYP